MGKKLLRRFLKEESGQVLVLFALLAIVIFGITAFVTDVGMLQSHKRHLQNTADAAALAGARDLADGKDDASATASVNKYVQENGVDENEVKAINFVDNRVTVDLEGSRGLYFARTLGFKSANVGAKATAEAGPPGGMEGLLPIGIEIDTFKNHQGGANFIDFYTAPGNWGWVNLDYAYTRDKNVHGDTQAGYIKNGFDKMIYIGDIILADTGANVQSQGCINKTHWDDKVQEYIDDCVPLYVPIINTWDIKGKKELVVVGFASIIITDQDTQHGHTGHYSMTGKINPDNSIFVGGALNPDPDAEDFGLKTIALVE